jgi:hypothetical protein
LSGAERPSGKLPSEIARRDSDEQTVTDRDMSRPVTLSPLHNIREGEREEARANAPMTLSEVGARVVEVLGQCDRLRIEQMGVENAIAAWPGRDYVRAAHTVVTWATDPTFRSTNAARLLGDALSKQSAEKVAAIDEKKARDARRLASMQSLGGGTDAA